MNKQGTYPPTIRSSLSKALMLALRNLDPALQLLDRVRVPMKDSPVPRPVESWKGALRDDDRLELRLAAAGVLLCRRTSLGGGWRRLLADVELAEHAGVQAIVSGLLDPPGQ